MKDYKHYIGTIITCNGREYPDFALGTYLRTEDEILELLKVYPYDKLMIDTAYRYNNEQAVSSAVIKSGYPQNQIVYIGKKTRVNKKAVILYGRNLKVHCIGCVFLKLIFI